MTGDDQGGPRDPHRASSAAVLRPRARQNVVFELGYTFGKMGRSHVAIIYESEVELPTDIGGICYIPSPDWRRLLARELDAQGFDVRPGH